MRGRRMVLCCALMIVAATANHASAETVTHDVRLGFEAEKLPEAWVDDIRFVGKAPGELRLAGVFSDHAVLQRGIPVPVWGWGPPDSDGEEAP